MSRSATVSCDDIEDRIRRLVRQHAPSSWCDDELKDDLPLFGGGIGLDSVGAVELVLATETTFDVKIPASVIDRELTIGALIKLVRDDRAAR